MALQTISEKTGIGIGLLLSVGGLLVGGAGTAMVAVYRVGALEQATQERKAEEKEEHAALKEDIKASSYTATSLDRRVTVLETTISSMNATLSRIEGKLDRQVVSVKGKGL